MVHQLNKQDFTYPIIALVYFARVAYETDKIIIPLSIIKNYDILDCVKE